MTIDINELRKVIADCYWPTSPVTINSLLDRLEAAVKECDAAIERLDKAKSALCQHHNLAMGEGLDPSHVLTKLRVSAYQQSCLYADTVAALEGSK